MSIKHELAPALTFNPAVGQMIALDAFAQQYRGFLEHMIAREHIHCITQRQKRYVVLDEIEPYSPIDLDEEFADTIVPAVDSGFPLACAVAQANKDNAVQEAQSKLPKLIKGWALSVEGTASTNPFVAGTCRSTLYNLWEEVAFIAAHVAGAEGSEKARAVLAAARANLCTDKADSYFDEFHKMLLSIAAHQLVSEFEQISEPGKGRLIVPQQRRTFAIGILSRLVASFSGYRGDPEGSETPRSIMAEYLQVAIIDLAIEPMPVT